MSARDDLRRRAEEIFNAALEVEAGHRDALVADRCGNDVALREEVESLLAAASDLDSFLDEPVTRAVDTPRRIGPYRLVREIGRGGMGSVWLAEQDQPIRRRVAVKVIRPGLDSREIIQRFQSERQAMALMDHPGVARVFDAGTTERDQPYFVMEYVDGESITDYCRNRRLGIRKRIELFQQVCEAIQHAHQKTLLHRDIKPSNVLVGERDGTPYVKVIDFGVAKAMDDGTDLETSFTRQGSIVGTPEYMSPEQAGRSGGIVDTRSDVYSLGVLLHQLLIGALPYDSERVREAISHGGLGTLYVDDPPRLTVRLYMLGAARAGVAEERGTTVSGLETTIRGELEWITMTALDQDPTRRYQSPSDLARDLQRHLEGESVVAAPPSRSYRARKFVRRHRAAVAAVGVVAFGVVLGVAGLAYGLVRAVDAEQRAVQEARTAEEITEFLVELFRVNEPGKSAEEDVSARSLLDRGVDQIRSSLDDDPLVRGNLLESMSRAYSGLGSYAKADTLAELAIADLADVLDVGDPRVTRAMQQWSYSRQYAGDPRGALDIAERALRDHAALHGETDAAAISLRNTRAGIYRELGELDAARSEFLALIDRLGGARSEEAQRALVVAWNNLASTAHQQSDVEGMRFGLERALTVMDSVRLDDPPRRAQIMMNIATASARLGDFRDGIERLVEVIPDLDRIFGPEHREAFGARMNLAVFYMFENEHDRAIEAFEELIPIAERAVGANHPQFATILHNYAVTLQAAKRPADAIEPERRALAIRREVFGDENMAVATTLQNLASFLADAGQLTEARERFEETLTLRERLVGTEHPTYAYDLVLYGLFLEKTEGTDSALETIERGLAIQLATLGREHSEVITSYKVLSEVKGRDARYGAAIEDFREAISIREALVGTNHLRVAEDLDGFAELLDKAGDSTGAATARQRASEIRSGIEESDR